MSELSIAVNVRHLIPNKMEGIGWFSYQMMKRITQSHPEIHFYFLFDRPFSDEFIFSDNITPIILSPPARHPLLIYYWNEWLVPNLLNSIKPNVYVSLDGFISKRAKYKQYAVIHDINFLIYPEYLTFSIKKLYDYFFVKHSHYADRVGTVSEFSKSEIVKYLNYPEEKIDVVYNASNIIIHNEISESIDLSKYTEEKDYFLYVSSIHPRKNVLGLIKAFEEYKSISLKDDKLIIVGRFFWGEKEIKNHIKTSKYKNDIVFTGRLDDATTTQLMNHAKAFVLVSHYEGFGVPIIEAMQLGTPVITSNTTSLNEIAADAALKVNPNNISEIAKAMIKIDSDKELVTTLIEKGKQRSKDFNWDNCANLLWKGIVELI
jgi:glycosyltransferase involved in cell wall biosynthesis